MNQHEHYRQAELLLDRAHHWTYGDGGDPVVGGALATEAQAHATLALAAATMPQAPTSTPEPETDSTPGPITVYRASCGDIPLGHYATAKAARAHCEDEARRSIPGASLDWIDDGEDGVAELVAAFGEDERPTRHVVTALTIEAVYDPHTDA